MPTMKGCLLSQGNFIDEKVFWNPYSASLCNLLNVAYWEQPYYHPSFSEPFTHLKVALMSPSLFPPEIAPPSLFSSTSRKWYWFLECTHFFPLDLFYLCLRINWIMNKCNRCSLTRTEKNFGSLLHGVSESIQDHKSCFWSSHTHDPLILRVG